MTSTAVELLSSSRLKFWIEMSKMRDTFGLPADIIWCFLQEKRHPIAIQYSSQQFEEALTDLIQIKQAIRSFNWPTEGWLGEVKIMLLELGA